MPERYIGMMSGTSADGIDAVIVETSSTNNRFRLIATHSHPFSATIKQQIESLFDPSDNEIDRLGELDRALGHLYGECVLALLTKSDISASSITAIGNHGQTLRHRPNSFSPFSLQIGDAATLAAATGIPVISDFRRADIARGGQGAPLAPGFHQAQFRNASEYSCIINIGGIANITLLPPEASPSKAINKNVTGWDTGPGNGLMDAWINKTKALPFDDNGDWAAQGTIDHGLLDQLLAHPYFAKHPPKSTGKEEFTLSWLLEHMKSHELLPEDIQRTLLELTARTIAQTLQVHTVDTAYVCGGGAYNKTLLLRLAELCPSIKITTTDDLGIAPTWVEAAAFAWLAHQFWHKLPGNLPSVTGARQTAVLGTLTYP
ncbi:MAG: anhydro-N-acetylmuramic acid kinase [Marinagarivorans sp.]|nr:anhydro-N-acetylmuramic acid kinase [Marinagarivorans sp.]